MFDPEYGLELGAGRIESLPSGWWYAGRRLAPADVVCHGSAPVLVRFAVHTEAGIIAYSGALVSIMQFRDTQCAYVRYLEMGGHARVARVPYGTTLRFQALDVTPAAILDPDRPGQP